MVKSEFYFFPQIQLFIRFLTISIIKSDNQNGRSARILVVLGQILLKRCRILTIAPRSKPQVGLNSLLGRCHSVDCGDCQHPNQGLFSESWRKKKYAPFTSLSNIFEFYSAFGLHTWCICWLFYKYTVFIHKPMLTNTKFSGAYKTTKNVLHR
jgi:hypothetical protein